MIGTVRVAESEVHKALFELAQSIAGHGDLEMLCNSLARSLRQVVSFDFLALILPNQETGLLELHTLTEIPSEDRSRTEWPADESSANGWVWTHQRTLVLDSAECTARWPDLAALLDEKGVRTGVLVPLSNGEHRVGVLGFGSLSPLRVEAETIAFLERVGSEFAVTVDSYLTRQELLRERDRLEVLFEITEVLTSSLALDDLLTKISDQLRRVVSHDVAALTVYDRQTGELHLSGLHTAGATGWDPPFDHGSPEGMPCGEALRTGQPVVVNVPDFERYPSPLYKEGVEAGFVSGCSIPLVTRNGVRGTLELGRRDGARFTTGEVRMLAQAGRQIAIALENSLAYSELTALKDKLATEKLYLEGELQADQNAGNMIGESPAFQSVLRSIQVVAPTDATVLISGETGTGKELVARRLHELSPRAGQSFIKVNCAAIPATLLESELFGHEKGAFTGALAQKMGRFELAHRGTLFLDEIGEIPIELQSKLLRAIQEQEFERVGGTRTIQTDIRFIAATNRDLKQMVSDGEFRSDLYYRLHVFPLVAPPLRERVEDIPLLARYFTQKYAQRLNRHIERIPVAAMEVLSSYEWPGNIRELQNVIERSVILTAGPQLHLAIPEGAKGAGAAGDHTPHAGSGERNEILKALKAAGGKISGPEGAAARLGIKRTTLQSRMKRLNIGREFH